MHIFPVTFKAGSDKLAAKALCAKDQAKKWQEVVNLPADGAVDGDDACEVAVKAIALNMAAFEQLGFTKTPTILTGEGQVFSNGPTAEQLRSATKLK